MRAKKTAVKKTKKAAAKKTRSKKIRVKKAVVWSLVNEREHELLTDKERTIDGLIPLVGALFPGINYYSITGFGEVLRGYVRPALKKRFPELQSTPAEQITRGTTVEITEFLPSNGYEWQDNDSWRSRFEELLAAA
jgi:hypothetical protein